MPANPYIQELIARQFSMNPPDDFIAGTGHRIWEVYKKEATAILTALSAAGLVIVPKVPTEAMKDAIMDASEPYDGEGITHVEAYTAMIAAAESGE